VAINGIVGSLFGKVLENADDILDAVITTDKEREEAKLSLKKVLLQAEKEAFEQEVQDRISARNLYQDDAIIQKVLATLFTVAYFGLTYVMFQYFVLNTVDLSEYEIGFISTVFGAMSAKVNTIIDFFFGGSSSKNNN
jgi:NH3-dependent NAD+ synthetase